MIAIPAARQPTSAHDQPAEFDYVVYGTAAWDSPWLTEHNLAHALASHHRVLYVEPPITPLTPIRYGVRAESLADVSRVLRTGLRSDGRIHVLQPLTVPPREHAYARRIAAPLVRRQIRRSIRQLGLRQPIVLAARSVLSYLGAAGEQACVYLAKDLVEAGGALLGKSASGVAAEQRRMLARADLVCAVTPRLRQTLAGRGVDAALLPHGFHADLAPAYDAAEPPPEYAQLPRPLLGYTGRIDGRLDFEALAALADAYRRGSVVLVGPTSPRLDRRELERLTSRPNVHFLGTRTRDALPSYVKHLDCSVMPYRDDEWLRHGSPLKLWDALYAGPPVVGSGCAALSDHALVRFANPPMRLAEVVAAALAEPSDAASARRAYALANTWEQRARTLDELVLPLISAQARLG